MFLEKIVAECVIIGGGPAGSQAARVLVESGHDVILIERDPLHDKPCGGGVPSTAFQEFSIPETLVKKRVEWIRLVSPGGVDVSVRLHGGYIAIVERKEFDSALREIALHKGTRFIHGEFKGFDEVSGRRIVSRVITDKGHVEIISRYAIVASGVNSWSFLRSNTKLKKVFTLSIKGTPVDLQEEDIEACEFYLSSSHAERFYSWIFPSSQGIVSAGTGGFEPSRVKDMLNRFLLRRGISINGKVRGYWIPLWHGSKNLLNPWKNVVVAGDAGNLVMPLSFEGIYYAMSSGKMAAEAIIEGKPSEYPHEWHNQFYRRFRIMKLLWNYFLRDDRRAEEMVRLHMRQEIQEASMRLWLRKDKSLESLLIYIKLFKYALGRYLNEILSR